MKSIDIADVFNVSREFPIFSNLSDPDLLKILTVGFKQIAENGEYLTRIHDPADCFYLILKGRIQVRGKNQTPLAWLGPGELLGEMGYFEINGRRLAEAVVIRTATVLQFHYAALRRMFERDPDLAQHILPILRGLMSSRGHRELLSGIGTVTPIEPVETELPHGMPASVPVPQMPPLVPIQIKAALSRCIIFEGFDDADLHGLMELGVPVRLDGHAPVFQEGDVADCLYVVALGRLAVLAPGSHEEIVAQILHGNVFGELPLALGLPNRTATVVAQTPASVVKFTYARLEEYMRDRLSMQQLFEANLARLAEERVHPHLDQ